MHKQPQEKFCKKAVVKNFAIFTGKTVLKTLFNSEYCKMFWSTYFEGHQSKAASNRVHETEKN